MADFHTHVTVSGVLGAGYSVAGMASGMPTSTALVGGGLCGVAGMLPDVDSDSGIPRRETMAFAAAIVPVLLVDRFRQAHLSHDQVVLLGAALYFAIRFVAGDLIGKLSVHRGMWHSVPAVMIFAGLAFLLAGPADDLTARYFKAIGVGLGAMCHLMLDEIYSVDTRGLVPKFKKSFGTAVKMYGKSASANLVTYAGLAAVLLAIALEPSVFARIEVSSPRLADRLQPYRDRVNAGIAAAGPQTPAPAPETGYAAPDPAAPHAGRIAPPITGHDPSAEIGPWLGRPPAPTIRRQ